MDNYERLEFLGDSILNTVVSESLFLNYTQKNEGTLSKKRSIIVARKNLNKIGKNILPKDQIFYKSIENFKKQENPKQQLWKLNIRRTRRCLPTK